MAIIKRVKLQPTYDVGDFVKVVDKVLRKKYKSNYKVFDIDIQNDGYVYKLVYERGKIILNNWFKECELGESTAKHVLRAKLFNANTRINVLTQLLTDIRNDVSVDVQGKIDKTLNQYSM